MQPVYITESIRIEVNNFCIENISKQRKIQRKLSIVKKLE